MFNYMQIHLYFIIPPIVLLGLIYHPLIGRREILKFIWLGFMATIWTTPWDNFILSHQGWSYPPGSVIGRIGYIPIEEHMFFILQPILAILLNLICTHARPIPFDLNLKITSQDLASNVEEDVLGQTFGEDTLNGIKGDSSQEPIPKSTSNIEEKIQTLPRRPFVSLIWIALSLIGLRLIMKTQEYQKLSYGLNEEMFYLGWILVWICPVISFLIFLGARCTREDCLALWIGTSWLWYVDTFALTSGSWSISRQTTLGVELWSGLPIEEALFFFLTTYLIILSSSLITHLHTLLLLCPELPPCPPSNPISHIALLAKVALNRPKVDKRVLTGLQEAEKTLKKGSSSFSVAKLAFGREMRIGLVVIYAWCRVTDNLIDDPFPTSREGETPSRESLDSARLAILSAIRQHLIKTYDLASEYPAPIYPIHILNKTLDQIPNLTQSDRSAFHLFSLIIPRLVPIYPFLELCDGYLTDLKFPSRPISTLSETENLTDHLPIKTGGDLMKYADDVAGSIASAICYLSWSILDSSSSSNRPVEEYTFAKELHIQHTSSGSNENQELIKRLRVIRSAREMGRGLQLVNISRDIAKDALITRLYVPISSFRSAKPILGILFPSKSPAPPPSYAPYSLPLLDIADDIRLRSEGAIEDLPRTARGGTRAMVSSYFEIAYAVRANKGQVDEKGIRVSKFKRIRRAMKAMWIGS
ncbi:uncharacterized protein IL334_004294 [Kwoniella shivajii]|uniref:Bifunctional lycopene cyclase/phytoene synthase n=1 Tax=Kwoniella shivajii TaxID=564305 RepID=A0ABZ1D1T9_9TREE|nr:hypothetical protein IL334_004294 [Kwoniella shivajii]